MTIVRSLVPATALLAVVAVAGCNRDRTDRSDRPVTVDDRPGIGVREQDNREQENKDFGTTTITGANVGSVSNHGAVDRIVAARCARETTCNNVGVDKHFQNAQACTQKLKADMKEDLSAEECPRGIDQKELDECLQAIRNEDCKNPIDTISRLGACRTSDLCLKTSAPNR